MERSYIKWQGKNITGKRWRIFLNVWCLKMFHLFFWFSDKYLRFDICSLLIFSSGTKNNHKTQNKMDYPAKGCEKKKNNLNLNFAGVRGKVGRWPHFCRVIFCNKSCENCANVSISFRNNYLAVTICNSALHHLVNHGAAAVQMLWKDTIFIFHSIGMERHVKFT